MVDRCIRTNSSRCDPSHITFDLRSRLIHLGSHTCQPYGFLLVMDWRGDGYLEGVVQGEGYLEGGWISGRGMEGEGYLDG